MNRRNALSRIALLGFGSLLLPALPALAGDESGRASMTDHRQKDLGVLAVELTVYDMIQGTQRKIAVLDSSPVLVSEGKKPFYVSIAEDSEDFLSVVISEKGKGGEKEEREIFAGKVGHQIFLDRGVVLGFVTHEK